MKRTAPLIVVSLLAGVSVLLGGGSAAGEPSGGSGPRDAVLARVDADSVTTSDLVELLSALPRPRPGEADTSKIDPDKVLKRLIQNRLLEQEGYRIGAQDDPMVRNQVWELTRHRAMLAMLDSLTADVAKPEEGEFEQVFDRENVMVRVSHILVDDEALAKALVDSLAAGVPFEALSSRHSVDAERAGTGGDLGWAREDLYVPEFRTALEGLSKGEVAGPVRTEEGWHVLLLADKRVETVGQSDAMRDQLREAATRERVMHRIRSFVESLKEKYGVVENDSLVATLDYASPDPEVVKRLHDSPQVIAVLPWRELTVAELTRRIRFEHFHGLEGKPDAGALRDKSFDEWVTELLLRHEAAERGFDRKPAIVAAASSLERQAIRELVIKMILDRPFDPSAEEIEAFYHDHAEALTPAPRVRAAGVRLADEESARSFRSKVEAGADIAWLAGRADGVVDPRPAEYDGWISTAALGLEGADVRKGALVGPIPAEGAWTVARVGAVEPVAPPPLEECRDRVVAMMKNERSQEVMSDAIERLESEADVRIAEGARGEVAMWIDDWAGVSTTPPSR